MRLLRPSDRAQAQQARRRRRLGQLRHREGPRALPRRGRHARPDRGRTPCRLRRRAPRPDARRDADAAARAAARRGRPHGAGRACGAWSPATRFTGWEWWSLLLSGVVVWWSGWPFHRAAAVNARHGASTMDTLVSLGTVAAWLWSAVAVVRGEGHLYLESAAVVTTFLLAGRYAEGRSKQRAGDALRSLMELGAKQVSLLDDDGERLVPVEELAVGDRFVVRPGEKIATDGVVEHGPLGRRPLPAHRRAGAGRGRSGRRGGRLHGQRLRAPGRPRHPGRRRHAAGPDHAAGRGGPAHQGAGRAARRPHLGGLRPGRAGDRAADAGRLAGPQRRRRLPPSRPRSPCSSSPARAPSGWPPPRR